MMFKKSIIFIFIILIASRISNAQLYKVYGYQPAEAGEVEFVLWNSYVPASDNTYSFFGRAMDRKGLSAHSLELEYGLSNKFGIAAYLDFEKPKDGDLKYVRTKAIIAHYAFFDKGSRPVDLGIYIEYIVNKKDYNDSEVFETRLILEKDIGATRIDFNPIFEKKVSGSEVNEGMEFNYALGLYYLNNEEGIYFSKSLMIQPGLELYGKMGEIAKFKEFDEQKHYIFPTVDFFIGQRYNWHLGLGFGVTDASDTFTIKSIFSAIIKF